MRAWFLDLIFQGEILDQDSGVCVDLEVRAL